MFDFGQNHHSLSDAVIYARVSSQAQLKAGMGGRVPDHVLFSICGL
jgi:hypothetical protein